MASKIRILFFAFMFMVGFGCSMFSVTSALEAPLINPLGDLNEYSNVEFRENQSWNISYFDPLGNSICHTIKGDSWVLDGSFSNGAEPCAEIAKYVTQLGETIVYESDDRLIYLVPGEGNE